MPATSGSKQMSPHGQMASLRQELGDPPQSLSSQHIECDDGIECTVNRCTANMCTTSACPTDGGPDAGEDSPIDADPGDAAPADSGVTPDSRPAETRRFTGGAGCNCSATPPKHSPGGGLLVLLATVVGAALRGRVFRRRRSRCCRASGRTDHDTEAPSERRL